MLEAGFPFTYSVAPCHACLAIRAESLSLPRASRSWLQCHVAQRCADGTAPTAVKEHAHAWE